MGLAREVVARYGVVLVLVALTLVFCVWLPDTFATTGNFKTMVNSQAVVLLLALAATLPLRTGDFDLSVASTMVFSSAVVAKLSTDGGWPLPAIVVVVVLVGLVIGLVNGLLTVLIGVDSFVSTLGMLTLLNGLTYWVTESSVVAGVGQGFLDLSRADLLGFPLATWYGWGLAGVLWYVYQRTPIGRYLLFIGGGRDAARLAGVPVSTLRIAAFMTAAVLSALTGVVLSGQLGAIDPSVSGQYLLQPFAAAFLGATTIVVGRFNALGTVVGLYLLVVGITGLQLLGAQPWVSDAFNGIALVVAVTLARLAARGRE